MDQRPDESSPSISPNEAGPGDPQLTFVEIDSSPRRLLVKHHDTLAALRESEERFRAAFDHAAIGMAIVSLEGRWLEVNRSVCRIVGYAEHELLVTDFQSITHPEDLDTDLEYVRRLIAGEIADYQMIKRYFHKLGHVVWVMLSVSLVREVGGKPLYFISQIQDITQRRQAEEALRVSEEEFRAMFELAGVGKIESDLKTARFLRVNRKLCEITGYSAAELLARGFVDISHPDDRESSRQFADQLLRGEITEHTIEKRYIRKDGSTVWVSVNAASIRDAHGQPRRGVATVVDITERKRAAWLESDRRQILEMVARDLPLPSVLDRLAEAAERQVDGSCAAVLLLNNGEVLLYGPGLPEAWRQAMRSQSLSLASRLATTAHGTHDNCGVTNLQSDPAWHSLRPVASQLSLSSCWTLPIQSSDGSPLALMTVFTPQLRGPSGPEMQTLDMVVKLATICIDHHNTTKQLAHLVRHDALTGLPNRILLEDRLEQAMALSRRNGKKVALLLIDVDRFKSINDTHGHYAGDHLLQQFSHRLLSRLRETDTMARLGGDEFAIVLPEATSAEDASATAKKLIDSLVEPFALAEKRIVATASIGIALYPNDAEDALTLKKKADAALYRAKECGRNGFAF